MRYSPPVRYWQEKRLEIIHHTRRDEYIEVQCALDGVLAVSMDIHKSIGDSFTREDDWLDYLAHSAETMISLYGDARHPQRLELPAEELAMAFA